MIDICWAIFVLAATATDPCLVPDLYPDLLLDLVGPCFAQSACASHDRSKPRSVCWPADVGGACRVQKGAQATNAWLAAFVFGLLQVRHSRGGHSVSPDAMSSEYVSKKYT
jgi:hypothetical protein